MKLSRALVRLLLLCPLFLIGVEAHATGTAAGSPITNTATAAFVVDGIPDTKDATHVFLVDEVLDLTLVSNDGANVSATTPGSNAPLSFTLTNTGNGDEPFALQFDSALPGDQFNPQNVRIYIDNGDAVFGIGSDTLYVSGVNEPDLAADTARVLFVVSDIPGALASGDIGLVRLTATAVTGSGTPGTTFAGAGTDGVDAVVGSTTANQDAQNGYIVAQITTTLEKSQSIGGLVVPDGTSVGTGATVTYTLVFTVSGVGTLSDVAISDAIPALTTYVPGSLTLNTVSLTDASGDDAGGFTGAQIEVVPNGGTLTAPTTQTVTFQVTID